MLKHLTKSEVAVLEQLDWRIINYIHDTDNDNRVEIAKSSPAGEDFNLAVDVENFQKSVEIYADDFDVDEHVELWLEAKRSGVPGVPTVSTLVHDAEVIQSMIYELSHALSLLETTIPIYSQHLTQRCINGMDNTYCTYFRSEETDQNFSRLELSGSYYITPSDIEDKSFDVKIESYKDGSCLLTTLKLVPFDISEADIEEYLEKALNHFEEVFPCLADQLSSSSWWFGSEETSLDYLLPIDEQIVVNKIQPNKHFIYCCSDGNNKKYSGKEVCILRPLEECETDVEGELVYKVKVVNEPTITLDAFAKELRSC